MKLVFFKDKFNDLESSVTALIAFYNYLTLLFSQSLLFLCNDNVTDCILDLYAYSAILI